MKRHRSVGPPRGRSGMTLTEVLFAMAILLVGVLSIMSLVPVAIHQVATASDNTLGAAIGQNVIVSLQNGQLDMGNYTVYDPVTKVDVDYNYNEMYREGEMVLFSHPGTPLEDTGLQAYRNWPAAIYALQINALLSGKPGYGNGAYRPSFQIPGDTGVFADAAWDVIVPAERRVGGGRSRLVPVPWAQDYYWSATFLPVPDDHDGDGQYGEDPWGDPDGDGDDNEDGDGEVDEDPLIMPGTNYRVQVAVWRVVNPNTPPMLHEGLQGTWKDGERVVTIPSAIGQARQFDYIRLDDYGVWYRIADIDDAMAEGGDVEVTLATPFTHPHARFAAGVPGATTIASDFKLVGVYEGIVESADLGGAP